MAEESNFGASFGDPRRYMGQSPLADVGKGIKQGLTAYALKESGFTDYLNKLGKKPVAGAIAPGAEGTSSAMSGGFGYGVQPMMPVSPDSNFEAPPAPEMSAPPADIGEQVLDGKWDGFQAPTTSPVSLQNQTDFNPLAPDGSNQFSVSGNDYQQVPGYGKLQKTASQIFGMG